MRKIFLLFAIITLNFEINAQIIGQWTTHTPGLKVTSVDVAKNKIYAATPYDIFYYNTYDNSINRITKVNGLSDIGINVIKYNPLADILFVGYSNANIDIIDNQGNTINIPDIYYKNIIGNKTINNVLFYDKYAYVCCGFGIVVIDLKRNEVKDTYIIGDNGNYLSINDLTINNEKFYAATAEGILYADINNSHLADYSQWTRFDNQLPTFDKNFSQIETFNGYVVANYSDGEHDTDTLYTISDTSWDYFVEKQFKLISNVRVCDDVVVVTETSHAFSVYDANKNCILKKYVIEPISTIYDKSHNCYWSGTNTNSLVKIYPDGEHEIIRFNGPYSQKVFSISASGNDVWVASGGYKSSWSALWNHEGFSHYDGDEWSFINRKNTNAFDTITDITCVKSDPSGNTVYAGSYNYGLLIFKNGVITNVYDYRNSSLGSHNVLNNRTFVTDIAFDSHNDLWIANSGTEKMLSVMRSNGSWEAFNIGTSGDISRLMIDNNDYKWIINRDKSLRVFNGSTTKTVSNNSNYGSLPGDANCFATDRNGTVWIGTTDGVALFHNTKKIFNSGTYACSRILIPRNDGSGQADYLLSGQSVLSIAVNGANNIWFGTTNGVFLISNDGQTTYQHFTTENSPLFDNKVTDIAIDDDGNVFFATDYGIISYRDTASKGDEKNSNVVVFPNPVRPEHRGIVGIKGLVTDALVKITTTSGNFVTHLKAQGGQAVWDCTDINGNKVAPGIYLIFVSDETGKETYATKVLIMK